MESLDIAGLVAVGTPDRYPDQFLEGKLVTTKSGYAEITWLNSLLGVNEN